MSERVEFLDIGKGFGIFCIVFGHNIIPHWLCDWVFSFHVPIFFILSGYFYKKRNWLDTLNKGWRQLLRPMLITNLIAYLGLLVIFCRKGEWMGPELSSWIKDILTFQNTGDVCGMWFLVSLFWGKIWYFGIDRMPSKMKPICVIILFCISYYLNSLLGIMPWKFFHGMMVPFFLYIGLQLHNLSFFERSISHKHIFLAMIIICLARFWPISLVSYTLPHGILSVIGCVLASLSVLILLKKWSEKSVLPRMLFLYAGQNTLFILCLHGLLHTWQLDSKLWAILPSDGFFHLVLQNGFFALAECMLLVLSVRFLNRIKVINDMFHG